MPNCPYRTEPARLKNQIGTDVEKKKEPGSEWFQEHHSSVIPLILLDGLFLDFC